MRLFVGTSGYGYKEWKGSFYPEKLPAKDMLSYYAQRFASVEINSTFRGLPSEESVEAWLPQTPKSFRFVLKAPQTITHRKRLKNADAETDQFLEIASILKKQRGPLLFQLPPNFKKDLPRLDAFLAHIGKRAKITFEFRHPSWFDDEVFQCLRKRACALCIADTDELPNPEVVSTTGWGYLRLRRENYDDKQLGEWIAKIHSQKWKEAYIFFKHEETGTGPKFASRLLELAEKLMK